MNKITRSRPSRPRAGWTLLETMVAHGMLALIMTLTALLIATLSRAERNSVRVCVTQQSLARLDELFRRDVHRAADVKLTNQPDQPSELLLSIGPEESVRYTIEQGLLHRIAATAGKEHRETYRIPDVKWEFALTNDQPVRKVTLRCQPPADTATSTSPEFLPLRDLRLEAALSLSRPVAAKKGGGS